MAVLLGLLALPSAGAQEAAEAQVRCADGKGVATADFDIRFDDESRTRGEVTRLRAAVGDRMISTDPAGSSWAPETVLIQSGDDNRLEIALEDLRIAKLVVHLDLFRAVAHDGTPAEFGESVVAGTLNVMGHGVWAVTCTGW